MHNLINSVRIRRRREYKWNMPTSQLNQTSIVFIAVAIGGADTHCQPSSEEHISKPRRFTFACFLFPLPRSLSLWLFIPNANTYECECDANVYVYFCMWWRLLHLNCFRHRLQFVNLCTFSALASRTTTHECNEFVFHSFAAKFAQCKAYTYTQQSSCMFIWQQAISLEYHTW